jgi:hypothetical protein
MEANARLYNCVKCRNQVIICSGCDRGNIYCPTCSKLARKQSLCAADRRYQNTPKGKLKHATRQKHYRDRLKNKVTDHGSPVIPANDLLPSQSSEQKIHIAEPIICHFCGNHCSPYVRQRFLQRRIGNKARSFAAWPNGP